MGIDLDALDTAHAAGLPLTTIDQAARAQAGRDAIARLNRSHGARVDHLTRKWDGPASPKPMTDKQRNYIYVLLRQLDDHNAEVARTAREWFDGDTARQENMTKDQASDIITRLKGHLSKPATTTERPANVPTTTDDRGAFQRILGTLHEAIPPHPDRGVTLHRYALEFPGGNGNEVRFYKLKESKAGRRYIVAQHGDAETMLRFENGVMAVAQRIAEDPKDAMLRYGRELGRCGHCGRTLTNDESRQLGIGPICRGKMGW